MLKTKAYKFILKVRKFQLPTVYSFSTAEGETWLWVDSAPHPGLNRVKLAIIWLEIVTKRYDELCHKISRSSSPLETDSVDIIFQHMLRLCSLYFFK